MKKLFIVTSILLIQSFQSFGSEDIKGLICKCTIDCEKPEPNFKNYLKNYRTFTISKKKSERWFYELKNDVVGGWGGPTSVIRNQNFITIYDHYVINRKTLEMKYKGYDHDQKHYWCKVYSSEEFWNKQTNIKKELQNEYNSITSKNKI